MKIDIFKKGDRVRVVKDAANASDFNKNGLYALGVYNLQDWRKRTFTIEGTIKLTGFSNEGAATAHLLADLEGNPVGYVYTYAIEPAISEWSYSLSTNTIWFSKDNGIVKAETEFEARTLATKQLEEDLRVMNGLLGVYGRIEVNLDELSVQRIESPK